MTRNATRLPPGVIDAACDVADIGLAIALFHRLQFKGDMVGLNGFLDAMLGTKVALTRDVHKDGRQVIVAKGKIKPGKTNSGQQFQNFNLIRIGSYHVSGGKYDEAIAKRILEVWDNICAIAKNA